jgi:hypothetical protein
MGVYFSMSVLPLDDRGEVVLEHVDQPSFCVKESLYLTPLGQRDRLDALFDGLDMRWFDESSLKLCLDGRRNPTRADCFDRDHILACVSTILERLLPDDHRIPRLYKIRRNEPGAELVYEQRVFLEGRVMHVHAGWDHCEVRWSPPRTTQEFFGHFFSTGEAWDLRIDLRGKEQFECHDVTETPDGPAQGAPLTLSVVVESPERQYRGSLEEMKAFCRAVDPKKYCVFTMRS